MFVGATNGGGNVISGNNGGIQVNASIGVQIINNLVGVNAAGTGPLGNSTRASRSETLHRIRPCA